MCTFYLLKLARSPLLTPDPAGSDPSWPMEHTIVALCTSPTEHSSHLQIIICLVVLYLDSHVSVKSGAMLSGSVYSPGQLSWDTKHASPNAFHLLINSTFPAFPVVGQCYHVYFKDKEVESKIR